MPKVFISYSHDSDEHRDFVRGIADRLRHEGVDCLIDQYINGFPEEGWQRWMENQVEVADFVLLVCTETYLRRYRGQETEGGKGVNFEGVVISQHLYDAYYQNAKFIPVIPAQGDYGHVPLPLKAYSIYRLLDEYDDVYRVLTGQAKYEPPVLGEIRALGRKDKVFIDRLPTVSGGFFGRQEELMLLDAALKSPLSPLLQRGEPSRQGGENSIRIIQFIAAGGTGKTKLLRHWLNQHDADIPNRIVWSFYSQGSAEDKQVSASPFFSDAFTALRADKTKFSSEEEKGDYLAELLIRHRCLLVLDGLEPLQYVGKGMDGRLKDRAITRLLQKLAAQHTSLCIITTRIRVHDISDRPHVHSVELDNLQPADGVALLQSLGVKGAVAELDKAVREYGCHALALHLLGNALTTYLGGDIHKRDTLDELLDEYADSGRHAFKVMQAYQQWLQGTPELQLLYLLGLFDHPIETEVLEVLWQAQIPDLTTGIPRKAWLNAIRNLREKHRLLSTHEGRDDLLDCHPLIREYFGGQLQAQQPEGWRLTHERLYEYYKTLPEKELPGTLEEMKPLFSSVVHGCAAGLHQQVLDEVYWPRIQRKSYFNVRKLAAFNDDLAVTAHFFNTTWTTPSENITQEDKAKLLNQSGFCLRAVGRLSEAAEVLQKGLEFATQQKYWDEVINGGNNLSELQLVIGNIDIAIELAEISKKYTQKIDNKYQRVKVIMTLADAFLQKGERKRALDIVHRFLTKDNGEGDPLVTHHPKNNFRCTQILLAQNEIFQSILLAQNALKVTRKKKFLLDSARCRLSLGQAYLQQNDYQKADDWLNQATIILRKAQMREYLPTGLLVRAALYRQTYNFTPARQDLQEVFDIAEPISLYTNRQVTVN
ncbi:MAG: SEFIR domain-containing protein [Thiothrix sp.]